MRQPQLAWALALFAGFVLALHVAGPHASQHGDGRSLLQTAEVRDNSAEDEVHRQLRLDARTAAALVTAGLVSALANSAGVGGGAFFVPLFNVVTGFSIKMSTALSQAVIAGGAIGSAVYALSRRHPLDRKRPLVDFDLTLLLTPILLLGVSAGVLLNAVFPTWVITFCLVALLCYLTARTAATSMRLHGVESRLHGMQQQYTAVPPGAEAAGEGEEEGDGGLAHGGETSPLLAAHAGRSSVVAAPAAAAATTAAGSWRLAAHSPSKTFREPAGSAAASPGSSAPSTARSLLAGLGIGVAKPWRSREAASGDGGRGSSLESEAFGAGSFEEGLGSGGKASAGLLQREVSMQRVSGSTPSRLRRGSGYSSGSGSDEEGGGGGGSKGGSGQLPERSWSPSRGSQGTAGPQQQQGMRPSAQPPPDAAVTITTYPAPAKLLKIRLLPSPFVSPGLLSMHGSGGSVGARAGEQAQRGEQQGPSTSPAESPHHPGLPSAPESPAACSRQAAAFEGGLHQGGDQGELEERRFPWASMAALTGLWLAFLGFQLAKSRLGSCSWGYAALYAVQAAAALGASGATAWQLLRRQDDTAEARASLDLEHPILTATTAPSTPISARQPPSAFHSAPRPDPLLAKRPLPGTSSGGSKSGSSVGGNGGSISVSRDNGMERWTARRLAGVTGIVLAGGAIAGLLGIGGGMVVGPLLLELGIHPQVSSATSGIMVLFSASVAAVSFAAAGRLNVPYAAAFAGVCLCSAFLGVVVVGRLVKRSGKASIIVMILALIMGLGAVLTAGYAGTHAVQDLIHGHNIGFSPFCS